jgi:hypothetical protein
MTNQKSGIITTHQISQCTKEKKTKVHAGKTVASHRQAKHRKKKIGKFHNVAKLMMRGKKKNSSCCKKNCGISQASKDDVFCLSFQWLAAKNKHSVSNGKKKAAGRNLENFTMRQISRCSRKKQNFTMQAGKTVASGKRQVG